MGKKVMSKRVMVVVRRDMAEATPVIVFCHEVPILQAIHGEGAISIVRDPMKVINQFPADELNEDEIKAQLESRKGFMNPREVDAMGEYNRLVERYGMHSEVNVANVEYIYGRPNDMRWKHALRMSPDDLADVGEVDEEESEEVEEAPRRRSARQQEAAA